MELPRKGILVCVSGPSGVGKGSVIELACSKAKRLHHSVSMTTRNPRPQEKEGISYYFTNHEHFKDLIEKGEMLEYDIYCENYYGTPRENLVDQLDQGFDVIMDITVPGSLSVIQNFPDAISIFLLPPSIEELRRRLSKRGTDSDDVINKRMSKSLKEITQARLYDYLIVNEEIENTASVILSILEAERHKYNQLKGIEDKILEEVKLENK